MGAKNLLEQHREIIRQQAKVEYEISKRNSRQSLAAYTRFIWPVIEPGNKYLHNWHIDVICDHLAAVRNFEITKLLINMPPRCMKSILVTVGFNGWVWIDEPDKRFIFASYGQELSNRDALKNRDIIESSLYQNAFNPQWYLRDDASKKNRYLTSAQGFRISTSPTGGLTGDGGDYRIGDDLQNKMEMKGKTYREEAKNFYKALSTRVNNPNANSQVMIQQRLHADDLSAHLLKEHGFEHLVLPMEFDPKIISHTSLNYKDPRTQDKQGLWPERFGPAALQQLKKDLDEDAYAELQQSPKPASGGLIKRGWWKYFTSIRENILEVVQFWDCAQKPGITNDYSVCATWARTQNGYYRIGYWRGKTDGPALEEQAKIQYNLFRPSLVIIEDASGGSSLLQYLHRNTVIPAVPFNPGLIGSKDLRASHAQGPVKAGKCFLPEETKSKSHPDWQNCEDFLEEHEAYPKGANDDTVDTTSMMVIYFSGMAIASSGRPRVSSI